MLHMNISILVLLHEMLNFFVFHFIKICMQSFLHEIWNSLYFLDKYIRERFKVKGTNEYKRLWNLLCECVEWNVYVISTFVNSLRSACRRILDFVEVILWDCIIKAFDQVF